MIERPAKIIAIHTDHMVVAFDTASACSGCGSKKACHGTESERQMRLPLQPGLRAGEEIQLAIEESSLNIAASLAWLLPAASLLIGAIVGQGIGKTDLAAMAGAATGCFLSLYLARLLAKLRGPRPLQPRIHSCFPHSTETTE